MNPRDAEKLLPLLRDFGALIESARGIVDTVAQALPWVAAWGGAVLVLLAIIALRK
jgi:hypothetical protein